MLDPSDVPPEVYDHLRRLAQRIHARHGHGQQTIQPTVLLHEAWMKLEGSDGRYESRTHFVATAARAMRQVLVDQARSRGAQKRGGDRHRTTLSGLADAPGLVSDVLDLDAAITALKAVNPSAADVVLMHTFGGMSNAEIAEVQGVSTRTVERAWRFSRAFLADWLAEREP